MHAHFLVGRVVFLWMWVSCCWTGSMLWSLDTETIAKTTTETAREQESSDLPASDLPANQPRIPQRGAAVFAGGCFWCIESDLEQVPGVIEVISGYSGGRTRNPTYANYAHGGHREVVFVVYDSSQITYAGLVEYLIKHIDPTNRVGQFQDTGRQYGPAIYYANQEERLAAQRVLAAIDQMKIFRRKLNVSIEPRQAFWPAEEYHQNYHVKNLGKYLLYRSTSGRDAFLQQHWGGRSERLELDGAYPGPSADRSRPGDARVPLAAHGSSRGAAGLESAYSNGAATDKAADDTTDNASSSARGPRIALGNASPVEPPWGEFQKPSPQALRQQLTTMEFRVTQHGETEPAFQNRYWNNHRPGIYVDVVSGEPLFSSADKFESGTGWPSFVAPIDAQAVRYMPDNKLSYTRIEVRSTRGDSHLGHLFHDGPVQRGGKRYCLNSAALRFVPVEAMASEGYADYLSLVGE